MVVSIDFETRSTVDLRKTGVYTYAAHPDTDVWVMAYAVDDGPVQTWLPGNPVPEVFGQADEYRAWNAEFERVIYGLILVPRYGFPTIPLEQWYDTAAQAATMALPRGLGRAAEVLGLDVQKDMDGRRLMLQMAKPRSFREDGTPIWWDLPEKVSHLIAYCRQDVEVERAIGKRLPPLSEKERWVYIMDQRANTRGFQVDLELVDAAQDVMVTEMAEAGERLTAVTGGYVTKVTDVNGITSWLRHNGLPDLADLRKDTVRDLLAGELSPQVREVLQIRADTGKTSTAKLDAFQHAAGPDGRVRGTFLYHGASTGRWSGRLVQPQNFPRPEMKDPELFIPAVLSQTLEGDPPPAIVVSSLLRSMIVSREGYVLRSGDYSQIEARVLAWVAGQKNLVQLFEEGGKVYEDMASTIFGKPVEEISKDSFERQIGKNSILGCGFGMGADRFADQVREQTGIVLDRGGPVETCVMCGYQARLEEGDRFSGLYNCPKCGGLSLEHDEVPDMAQRVIDAYREKNKRIRAFWDDIYTAAYNATIQPGRAFRCGHEECIRFKVYQDVLWCTLPSGRHLAYNLPEIEERETPWGEWRPTLTYCGITGPARRWERVSTYGGHLTENVVQAIARDCMAEAWLRLEVAGYPIIMTVHDELVAEVPEGHGSQEEFERILATRPAWAQDLPIEVEGWEGHRYRK